MRAKTPEIHEPGPHRGQSAKQLAADIRVTRGRLAATVEELVARTDVRSRARLSIERKRRRLRERAVHGRLQISELPRRLLRR